MDTTATVTSRLHQQAMAAPLREMAGLLWEVLDPKLTAFILGLADAEIVVRWARGEEAEIGDHEVDRRLRTAYEMVSLLLMFDAPPTIQAWFVGMNDVLGDIAPAEAVRSARFEDALAAATAFVAHG